MLLHWFQTEQIAVSNVYAARTAGVRRPKKAKSYPLPEALRPEREKDTSTIGKARPVEEIDAWLLRKNGR